jgi:hypothetical protein
MSQIADVGQGAHLCVYYDNDEARASLVAAYVAIGLDHNERCLCVAEDAVLLDIVAALVELGVDAAAERQAGRLLMFPPSEAHLQGGRFDAEGMLKMLDDTVERALDEGFSGLRAAGDMSWILEGAPGTERVFEYEAMMNGFYPTSRAVGMCLYDRRLLPASALEKALHTHPVVGENGRVFANPHFDPANQPGS